MGVRMNAKLARREFEFLKRWRVVSIFWVTETRARARRLTLLEKAGVIRRERVDREDAYPHCVFVVNERKFETFMKEVA